MIPDFTHLHVLPLFHAYGLLYMFLSLGTLKLAIMKRFNIDEFGRAVEKYKVRTTRAGRPARRS